MLPMSSVANANFQCGRVSWSFELEFEKGKVKIPLSNSNLELELTLAAAKGLAALPSLYLPSPLHFSHFHCSPSPFT